MSISQIIKPNKILFKLKLYEEYLNREIFSNFEEMKIYFPYRAEYFHPAFDELMRHPPINYVNRHNAELFHYIQGANPNGLIKNHIVEVIDHALSILAPYNGLRLTCSDYVNQIPVAKELYESPKIKKIIFISEGQREIFAGYFPDSELMDKTTVIPLAWHDNTKKSKHRFTDERKFLFIASNYTAKGVQIVLDAWEIYIQNNPKAKLTLVSHDIPKETEAELDNSISLIKKAPLPKYLKEKLYAECDVSVATTLTDGVTPIEATSYGKPVIIFRTQHSKDFIDENNGILVDVPVNIYDDEYGIKWKTNDEYLDSVVTFYNNGRFKSTIKNLVDAFAFYDDETNLKSFTNNSISKYRKSYRIEIRHQSLKELYRECYKGL